MEVKSFDVDENEKCLICGGEKLPADEFGTKDCDCLSLAISIGKALQKN